MKQSRWLSRATKGLEELAASSFKKMCLIHQPPYRALYSGGAGIAYAFWKAACILEEPEWLHQARFWIDHAASAPEDERIMKHPQDPNQVVEINMKDSIFFGNPGVAFVRTLIAHTEDDPRAFEKALKEFTSPESENLEVEELLQGIPGRLVGCALLFRETHEEKLKQYGDSLAEYLIGKASVSQGKIPWQDNHKLGLAHGRAGNYYALLLWSKESGYSLPDWILPGLKEYARSGRKKTVGISWPVDERDEKTYMNTWCNGAPGLILLWTLTYDLFKEPLFLQAAQESAEYSVKDGTLIGDLCCGAAGIAYALLSLNRIDPDGPWLNHANHYIDLATRRPVDIYFPLSLYKGLAGIVCLSLDMANPKEAVHPAVQG